MDAGEIVQHIGYIFRPHLGMPSQCEPFSRVVLVMSLSLSTLLSNSALLSASLNSVFSALMLGLSLVRPLFIILVPQYASSVV